MGCGSCDGNDEPPQSPAKDLQLMSTKYQVLESVNVRGRATQSFSLSYSTGDSAAGRDDCRLFRGLQRSLEGDYLSC